VNNVPESGAKCHDGGQIHHCHGTLNITFALDLVEIDVDLATDLFLGLRHPDF
jgi:hypothetical protein